MKISTKGRYAVTAMLQLGLSDSPAPITLMEISEAQGISLSYLEQLFAKLRQGKLVEGARGPGGGYRLARDANAISIGEILGAVNDKEKRTTYSRSLDGKKGAGGESRRMWYQLSDQVNDYLGAIRLAHLIEDSQQRVQREAEAVA